LTDTFTSIRKALDDRISALPDESRAALFAAAASALLPVYERFVARQGWGDAEALWLAIAAAEDFVMSGVVDPNSLGQLSARMDAATPHGDDFDDPETTGAQDAAIAADVALRAARGLPTNGMFWYVLEYLDQTVTLRRTGFSDIGSGPAAIQWESEILGDVQVAAAITAVDRSLSFLDTIDLIDHHAISELRQLLTVLDPITRGSQPSDITGP
jgi:hypothetical protein